MIKIDVTKRLNFENSAELTIKHEFEPGGISAIYGKSGAGKTTLLKIIAGLIKPEKGVIEVNGQTWLDTGRNVNIPVQQRNIGFVFQDYALFPNMTVKQNLLYAAGKNADDKHIAYLLKITGLESFADVKPDALSGGQKQRTALARALVRKPSLLLLDEPLSATDTEMRAELQQQLLQLQHEYKFTALLVSHDKNELRTLTNHILYMDSGRVLKSGPAAEVFNDDATRVSFTGTITETCGEWMNVVTEKGVYRIKNKGGYTKGEQVKLNFDPNDAHVDKI